ncbi:DNA polymerase II [Gemmatimonas phototrophica]|uniref:DNA-directed DNA polymerase n=1 Tax=Gemmatimonas phototrophica TaxID=1379270 RepID=A0A143BNF2_9BACT|nr:DNA polymerase II [Gemmatimonas phototrophica]
MTIPRDEWLWGWDTTPGIVSVWAEESGQATVWRRPDGGALLTERAKFRPWVLLSSVDDLRAAGVRYQHDDGDANAPGIRVRELAGPGALRVAVSAERWNVLETAICRGASKRLGQRITRVQQLPRHERHVLPPEEQYLVATGRTYFRNLAFAQLQRLQFDLETTGLDPRVHRIFLIAVGTPHGDVELLEARGQDDHAEADLLRRFVTRVQQLDPDVIENHNLHGFDLPFVRQRAKQLRVPLPLGRLHHTALVERAAMRGVSSDRDGADERRVRLIVPGRECIDTLDAVRRYDFAARELPGYGLKAVARHFGLSGPARELIPGDRIHAVYASDPDRVRRYAAADVTEVAGLARILGGAAFALARMAPRRYERLADAGAATGVIDPLLVRAYLRAGHALPAHADGDGTVHSGAALYLFTAGVVQRVVKVDVASLYPSLMRAFRIGPVRDPLQALLFLVDQLVEQRLHAKQRAKEAAAGSDERFTQEAMSAAMKLVVNSAYGYLAAGDGLTRFADVHAANEVTRRGRETLLLMCRALAERGAQLIEADTDGVYFGVPDHWSEHDERAMVDTVAALLPPLVRLEFEGRYAAMLSHEAKNYALLTFDGRLQLKGVAFRSSRAEPYGEAFLRTAIARLLAGDVIGVRAAYLDTLTALHGRAVPTVDVASRVRLRKSPEAYARSRQQRREFAYEALWQSGRQQWAPGDRVRVYRGANGTGRVIDEVEDEARLDHDARDYDVAYYAALLRRTFAARLARAFHAHDFDLLFADAEQLPLFAPALETIRPVATREDDVWQLLEPEPLSTTGQT